MRDSRAWARAASAGRGIRAAVQKGSGVSGTFNSFSATKVELSKSSRKTCWLLAGRCSFGSKTVCGSRWSACERLPEPHGVAHGLSAI